MIIPGNRFNSGKRYYSKHSYRLNKFFVLAVVLIVGSGAFFLVSNIIKKSKVEGKTVTVQKTLEQLWKEGSYKQLAEKCEERLSVDPLDPKALIYGGFSNFYLGVGQFTMEEKIPLFDKAAVDLRKILLLKQIPLKSKVEYILGKVYYNKGRYYLDLSIEYFKKSLKDGLIGDDTYKYLGMAYGELEMYKEAINYFFKALKMKPDDMLFLVLGQTYYKMGDSVTSEKYLMKTLTNTTDFVIDQKARFLLGKIYLDTNKFDNAIEQFTEILKNNKNSANAHYYLGEIYSKLNKKVKARAEWRKVLEIDPSHYGALLKLY